MNNNDLSITNVSHGDIVLRSAHLDWDTHPLKISSAQLRNIKLDVVMNPLTSTQSPSEKAGLEKAQLSSVAKRIDREFRCAVQKYVKGLDKASIDDLRTVGGIENITIGSILWEGAKALLRLNFGEFIYKTVRAQHVAMMKKEEIRKKGSTARVLWLKNIESEEESRLKSAKKMLKKRSVALIKSCKKSEERGIISLKKLKELEQLSKIFTALFPQEEFIVDIKIDKSESVHEFVNSRRNLLNE
ncbi:hypothetical protein NEOC65_001874 [Neochlamydia sp. AcF65]|uniref:hypothetical protein n=1 Tax=Neochlamydia sp. AcF65 TaxID=2795735 RepID=UPI001BCA4D65|nr:hypothetical protein [Neochlamydia sp. AcF65]MBS4166780.1 hypothetical protein [Neochlamydia sp. AcF65]